MCDVDKYSEKVEELDAYLEYVVTDVTDDMMFENNFYAAYAALFDLNISDIRDWYTVAENAYVATAPYIEDYIATKYRVETSEAIDYFYEKEVHRDQFIAECGGYFFFTD